MEFFNPDFEPAVEIYQVRGSYEDDVCEMQPQRYGRGITSNHSVRAGLNRGYKFGFTSGGKHEGVGITAVFAPKLTRASIFEALQKRRVYGTTSIRILLDFRIDGFLMGSEIVVPKNRTTAKMSVTASCGDAIDSVTLVSRTHSTVVFSGTGERQVQLHSEIQLAEGYYYIRLKQKDGNIAWSSPIFIRHG